MLDTERYVNESSASVMLHVGGELRNSPRLSIQRLSQKERPTRYSSILFNKHNASSPLTA